MRAFGGQGPYRQVSPEPASGPGSFQLQQAVFGGPGPYQHVPPELANGPGISQLQQVTRVTGLTKLLSILTFCLSTLYIFSLPILSRVFNDSTGFGLWQPGWKKLCWTPSDYVFCGDRSNYTLLAMQHNRLASDGMYVGCSCGQGVFGDWLCKVQSPYDVSRGAGPTPFSISYYISTPSGTGMMAAVTAWPILSMWLAGIDDNGIAMHNINPGIDHSSGGLPVLWWTQVAFQLCYGLFLFCTSCIFEGLHGLFVSAFILSMVVHYSVLACKVGCHTLTGRLITTLCVVGVVSVLLGAVISHVVMVHIDPALYVGQYAFWLGECVGLTSGFAIGPILLIMEH